MVYVIPNLYGYTRFWCMVDEIVENAHELLAIIGFILECFPHT